MNHEFFILITDSMLKTHPGLRDMLRDRCALGGEDKGYFDGVAAMTFVDRWCKKMHGYHPHHDFYQKCLETILKMTLVKILRVKHDAGIGVCRLLRLDFRWELLGASFDHCLHHHVTRIVAADAVPLHLARIGIAGQVPALGSLPRLAVQEDEEVP